MASYTEYFYEYIENGNTVPNSFGIVPSLNGKSFETLFKQEFNSYEIGLETETLFKERLQAKADIVCPLYAERITKLAGVNNWLTADRDVSIDRQTTQSSYLNTPNVASLNDDNLAGVLKDSVIETDTESVTPKGKSKVEIFKDYLTIENLYQKLLDEFKPLFLYIW